MSTYTQRTSGKRDKWIKDFDIVDWFGVCYVAVISLSALWLCWIY